MRPIVLRNRGVTLVEVMIALVIILIIFMGLIQASIVSINSNMRNVIRDEAVRLTSDRMTRLRASDFDALASFNTTQTVPLRNTDVPYALAVTVTDIDTNTKQIAIQTTWSWQGEGFTHRIESYRRR